MRWFLSILVLLVVILTFIPTLQKWGLGRLPGDINFTLMGRRISIPLMSTILLACVVLLWGRLF